MLRSHYFNSYNHHGIHEEMLVSRHGNLLIS